MTREQTLRLRHRDEFDYYAPRCLTIKTKDGGLAQFELNTAQRFLHRRIEDQLARTGRVRALILKGRQQGCSTYTEGRFYWRVSHRRGVRAFILTHHADASNNLFAMAKRFNEHCPEALKPHTAASNAKELVFDVLDSGYRIGTAGSDAVGRSDTLQYFHGSEVAYWPHAEEHMGGVLQAVPDRDGTEVILESTSAGAQGAFYEMCQAAARGESDYELIFIPWFWQREYRRETPVGWERTADEELYTESHGVDDEQLAWRRAKIVDLGVAKFRREYPATVEEAFAADIEGALWKRELIDPYRVATAPDLVRIVVAVDPAGTHNPKSDETGIVAAGLGTDGRGYVLDDRSCRETPNGWAARAVALFERLKADRIVAEKNYGGEMVETVIRSVSPNVPVTVVTATRGKAVRAEPVVGLYEQGRVSHVGTHIVLEDQMTSWIPGKSDYSPDRVDALTWALTHLMLGGSEPRVRVL